MSENYAIIGSGNGLLFVRCQAITCSCADVLAIVPFGKKCSETLFGRQTRFKENAFENWFGPSVLTHFGLNRIDHIFIFILQTPIPNAFL